MRKMCNTITYLLNIDLTQRISEPTITFKNKLIKSILQKKIKKKIKH